MEINTTLLREKFTIRDVEREGELPIVAMSNRLVLPLVTAGKGRDPEVFVIRAQNMHGCIRMAAQLVQNFLREGPIVPRVKSIDFDGIWNDICEGYETEYNLVRWVCIYYKGVPIFSSGAHHSFLDVIEKCDSKNPAGYDKSLQIAEDTFLKLGRKISISYDSNIGMVLNVKSAMARCGLIYRGIDRNATFNFVAEPAQEKTVSPFECLNIAAIFLEGLQLAYNIGVVRDKLQLSLTKKYSSEDKKSEKELKRIEYLNFEYNGFSNRLTLKFRPEKPDFFEAIQDAEKMHRKMHDARKMS